MPSESFTRNSMRVVILLVLFAFSQSSNAQGCPAPSDPIVYYEPADPFQAAFDWWPPFADCDILGYEIEYAFYDFVPGTGSAYESMYVSGPIVTLSVPSGSINSIHVYIRTICDAPCGLVGGGDGNGNGASNWVLATIFVAPPPPPPPPDGSGDCSDATPPVAVDVDCIQQYNPFYEIYEEDSFSNYNPNPCTGEEEYMIWNQFISPPTGDITLTGNVTDFGGSGGPDYDSFGFVIYTGGCDGEMIICEPSLSVDDTLAFSVSPGEIFIVGTWFNDIEFEFFETWETVDFNITLCEPEPDCMYPLDVSVSENTDQSVLIEWSDDAGTEWIMEYGPDGFTPGTGTELLIDTEAPYLLDGLQPSTEYDFYLYNHCDDHGGNSVIIGPTDFSTYPSISIVNPVPNGQFFCCDEFTIPETAEVEAFCDSIYFSHADSLVGDGCPYTIHRTITVHDTCGNSLATSFHYDILDNGIPCGCESEFAIPNNEVGDAVALHGDWAVIEKGMDEVYYYEDGEWTLFQSIQLGNSDRQTLDIYGDVIVSRNKVYRLSDGEWSLETTLDDSEFSAAYELVSIHENTIALSVLDQINIYEYAEGEWALVSSFNQYASSLDLDENKLIIGINGSDEIGHIYHKSGGEWNFEQELNTFGDFDDFYSNYGIYDVAIDGNHAAVGFQVGGYLFTYFYDGEQWVQEELLTNPYREGSPNGYFTFGNAVDIDNGVMVVGDYRNQGFTGSIVVFERACDSWVTQREIWSTDAENHHRFGACLSLHDSKMVVGVNLSTYYINQSIPYEGDGKYWFYECLEADPTFALSVESESIVSCMADVPPTETSYSLGTAWCSSTEVTITADTVGTDCDLTITRVFTVSDSLGNTASATQQITVLDDQSPEVVSAPTDQIVSCIDEVEFDEPVFIDNCTVDLQIVFMADTILENCIASIAHTWVATDNCGNSTSVSRTITINDDPPAIDYVPESIQVTCVDDIPTDEPLFSDFCSDSLEVIFESDTSGAGCNLLIEQSWTAVDHCGNSTTASRTITVEIEPPILVSAPEDEYFSCEEEIIASEPPVFSSSCGGSLEVTSWVDTLGSECNTTIEYHWLATNECGNQTEYIKILTISDETSPEVVSVPEDLTISCTEEYSLETPEFTDNCSFELQIDLQVDTINTGCTTSIAYTWEATDECGNSSFAQKTVNIIDENPPTLECPEDFTVILSSLEDSYVLINLLDSAVVNDDCAIVDFSQSVPPGTPLTPGFHSILVSATDGCHTVDCSVEIDITIDTGVNGLKDLPISVFPNPSSGVVYVELPDAGLSSIQLFDMTGELVLTQEARSQMVMLHIEHLAPGGYTLLVNKDDSRTIKKLILLK